MALLSLLLLSLVISAAFRLRLIDARLHSSHIHLTVPDAWKGEMVLNFLHLHKAVIS